MPDSRDQIVGVRRSFRNSLFRWRGWLNILMIAVCLAVGWPIRPNPLHVWIALPIVTLGVAFRVWARCYFVRGSDTRRIQAHRFVQDGPYRHVRNPLYVGNILIAAGLAFALLGPWIALGLTVGMWVMYQGVIQSEEKLLLSIYGDDYRRMMQNVPRWIPRILRAPVAAERLDSRPRVAFKKEWKRITGAYVAWGLSLALSLWLTQSP